MRPAAAAVLLVSCAGACVALPSLGNAVELARRLEPSRSDLRSLAHRHGHHDEKEHEEQGLAEAQSLVVDDLKATATATATEAAHSHTAAPAHSHNDAGDEHSHHHSHAPPLLELNETQILLSHSPDPPSYFDFDQSEEGKPALLYVHIALMSLAFFGCLPLGAHWPPSPGRLPSRLRS